MPEAARLAAILLLPWLGSLAAALLPAHGRRAAAWLAGGTAMAALFLLLSFSPEIAAGSVPRASLSWLPSLGLELTFRLDGLALLFAVLVSGIGALVILYAHYSMASTDPVPRFFSFLLAFMGSMLGLVLAGNLIQLVFFWELTSVFSFLLIGYWHHNQRARDGARMALVVTAAGGVSLLLGCLLLGRITGSYDIDAVRAAGDSVRAHPWYLPTLLLILAGAFTKSAQFPFHFWLPHAMAAPTPVSAYLHSATLVKAGIYVLMLLWPVFAGTTSWYLIVGTIGLVTLLIGAWAAIFQHDLKGLLAYSTISHLGLITLLLGLGSALGAVAAVFHTINHAIFKASLFMAAGVIDHETGTRDLRRLGGLAPRMPYTAALAMIAAAAMAGVPLLNGFLSKEMFHAEALQADRSGLFGLALPVLATLASMFAVLYSVRFIHQIFFGPVASDLPRPPHEAPHWMRLPIELLVLACLLIGLIPAHTIGPPLAAAVGALLGGPPPAYNLSIWHGFNLPLLMSMLALSGGALLYRLFGQRLQTTTVVPLIGRYVGQRNFEITLAALIDLARATRELLRSERLQVQLRLLLLTLLLGLAVILAPGLAGLPLLPPTPPEPAFALLWLAGGAGAIGAAVWAKYHRLAALVMLGLAGLAVCVTFVWLAAPDLGLTQLLVEIITLVLLLLGLRWLPKRRPPEAGRPQPGALLRRAGDAALAGLLGIVVGGISLAMMRSPAPDGIGSYFLAHAYAEGGGMNVVNVILVDFRALDTLGEISVLAIAAVSVFAALRRFRPAPDSMMAVPPPRQRNGARALLVPAVIMTWMVPVILTIAFFLLMRGHDLPGGGFVAGVAAAIALLLLYMALGTRRVEARLHVHPLRWLSLGLLLASGTGAGALLFGRPFLTTGFTELHLPLIGPTSFASAMLFDLGVFAVVVGIATLILLTLAHQSLRVPRNRRAAGDDG